MKDAKEIAQASRLSSANPYGPMSDALFQYSEAAITAMIESALAAAREEGRREMQERVAALTEALTLAEQNIATLDDDLLEWLGGRLLVAFEPVRDALAGGEPSASPAVQSAVEAFRERAAKVAETPEPDDDRLDRQVRRRIAAAIRSLPIDPTGAEPVSASPWRPDALPSGHTVLEQADMLDGRVSQTVRAADGQEYQRIVHADEAYAPPTPTGAEPSK